MKAVVQRVKNASVSVDGKITGRIDRGLLVYLGVAAGDSEKEADWTAEKTVNLRIFDDDSGKMNLSLSEFAQSLESGPPAEGSGKCGVLAVSQFTLLADARKGRRPSYGKAAAPELAKPLYEYFIKKIRSYGLVCEEGVFKARMELTYTNDGPVTILLDTELASVL
ncbi:MAG: D-tyrosyl-tRNA(Tyr) deacylase [Treponema sp.]|jgi:D-tyrosyl-tRNA(Tyr) deacylase|nr:D-tyrosyl-tRNA(Tyr) deacylase [Treponema sp.]